MQIVAVGTNMIVFPHSDSETGAKTQKRPKKGKYREASQVLNLFK